MAVRIIATQTSVVFETQCSSSTVDLCQINPRTSKDGVYHPLQLSWIIQSRDMISRKSKQL